MEPNATQPMHALLNEHFLFLREADCTIARTDMKNKQIIVVVGFSWAHDLPSLRFLASLTVLGMSMALNPMKSGYSLP